MIPESRFRNTETPAGLNCRPPGRGRGLWPGRGVPDLDRNVLLRRKVDRSRWAPKNGFPNLFPSFGEKTLPRSPSECELITRTPVHFPAIALCGTCRWLVGCSLCFTPLSSNINIICVLVVSLCFFVRFLVLWWWSGPVCFVSIFIHPFIHCDFCSCRRPIIQARPHSLACLTA